MAKTTFSQGADALKEILELLSSLDEKQRIFILNSAIDWLELRGKVQLEEESGDAGQHREAGTSFGQGNKTGTKSPKEFLKDKKPTNFVEQITCLAYYLTHHRDIGHFKTSDITKLNTEAAGQRITNAAVFTRNAVSQNGYLAQAGGGKRQITPRGEALVEALPDRAKVKQELESHPLRTRKPRKKNGTISRKKE